VTPVIARQYHDKNLRSCEVVFQRKGYDVETLYWAGSLHEVQQLAAEIALKGGADSYRINEFSGGHAVKDYRSSLASDA
jgi:hypothetical protein